MMVANKPDPHRFAGEKVKVSLGAVQETLVLPLWARAKECDEREPILRDEVARDVMDRMDYDFSKLDGSMYYQVVMADRHASLDVYVQQFLKEHPSGTIIEIGCGLSTRFERLDNDELKWFDIDLADTIAVRRKFFDDRERHWTFAGSITERDWIDYVKLRSNGPFMLVVEGVLMYFDEVDVKQILDRFVNEFPGAWLAMDSLSPWIHHLQQTNRFKFMDHMAAKFKWSIRDLRQIESWNDRLHVVDRKNIPSSRSLAYKRLPMRAKFLERYVIPRYGHTQVCCIRFD